MDIKDYLLSKGITGSRLGEIFKQIKGLTYEQAVTYVETGEKPARSSVNLSPGSVWWWLCKNPVFTGMGSNSEKRRWLEDRAVLLNGVKPGPTDDLPEQVVSLVFFPSSSRRITML